MDGEGAREKKVQDAASEGDVTTFQQLVQEDPCLLDRVTYACSNRSPLHTATLQGNLAFVQEVLMRNPQLARELDSQMSSPLHIAAAQGYVEIASLLLLDAPGMSWSRDCHGMNPVHIAAVNGHVEILKKLLQTDPFPAWEKVDRGHTALHLCVKHRQLEALKVLARDWGVFANYKDDGGNTVDLAPNFCELVNVKDLAQDLTEIVNVKDDDGNTVLHLAAAYKQLEMVQYLVKRSKIQKQLRNSNGLTALEILYMYGQDEAVLKIIKILRKGNHFPKMPAEAVNRLTDVVMVTVILIITMAFQAVVSPPGGVWQEDSSTHRAGEAVMASSRPEVFKHFVRANTIAFVSSFVTIFLLTTGASSINHLFTAAVLYTMWISLASIAVSYGASVMIITPNMESQSLRLIIAMVVLASVSAVGTLQFRACIKAFKYRKG